MGIRLSIAPTLLLALALLAPSASIRAQQNEDTFYSSGAFDAPERCGTVYAACAAARRFERGAGDRLRQAGLACAGHLNIALAEEDALNGHLERMRSMKGRERDAFFKDTVQPTNRARVAALDAFGACTDAAMADLRPPGFPASGTLLYGGVANDAPEPASAAEGATLAAVLHRMDRALDPVAEPIRNLSNVLDAIAPHYDMVSRNDTGIRVVQDILRDMGLGHAAGKVPGALRAMMGKAGPVVTRTAKAIGEAGGRVAKGVAGQARKVGGAVAAAAGGAVRKAGNVLKGGTGQARFGGQAMPFDEAAAAAGRVFYGTTRYELPPGMELPRKLYERLRPLYPQEDTHSCVQACVRMVAASLGRFPGREKTLREAAGEAYQAGTGTAEEAIAELLDELEVPHRAWQSATFDDVAAAVEDGLPAIVSYGKEHVGVVDLVVEHAGEQWVFVRNPVNPDHWDALSAPFMEALGVGGYVVAPKGDFLGSFTAGGSKAVFTNL